MTRPTDSAKPAESGAIPAWGNGLVRSLAICLGLGLIFAWLGVYNTGEISFPERVVYWTGLIALGYGSAALVNPLVFERWMASAHPALQIAVVACLISVPITIGLIVIEYLSDGTLAEPAWWWIQFGYVIVISVLLTAAGWAMDRLAKQAAAPLSAPQPQPADTRIAPAPAPELAPLAFADRLPPKFRVAEIHAVSAENHYLRVHTSAGEAMILMRLADAIRELAALQGMQTHRSWWVAKQGLAGAATGDGRVTLKLKSGAEAPVSRTYAKAVKDAGWL